MKCFIFVLTLGLMSISPFCFAEEAEDSEMYGRANQINEQSTRDAETYAMQVELERESRKSNISAEERAEIIEQAKKEALEEMREEARLEEEYHEKKAFRKWEKSHPFSAMICQGDRSCMR